MDATGRELRLPQRHGSLPRHQAPAVSLCVRSICLFETCKEYPCLFLFNSNTSDYHKCSTAGQVYVLTHQ